MMTFKLYEKEDGDFIDLGIEVYHERTLYKIYKMLQITERVKIFVRAFKDGKLAAEEYGPITVWDSWETSKDKASENL